MRDYRPLRHGSPVSEHGTIDSHEDGSVSETSSNADLLKAKDAKQTNTQNVLQKLNNPAFKLLKKMFPHWKSSSVEIVAGIATVGALIAFGAICFSNPVTGSALLGVTLLAGAGMVSWFIYKKFADNYKRVQQENNSHMNSGTQVDFEDKARREALEVGEEPRSRSPELDEKTPIDPSAGLHDLEQDRAAEEVLEDVAEREAQLHAGRHSGASTPELEPADYKRIPANNEAYARKHKYDDA